MHPVTPNLLDYIQQNALFFIQRKAYRSGAARQDHGGGEAADQQRWCVSAFVSGRVLGDEGNRTLGQSLSPRPFRRQTVDHFLSQAVARVRWQPGSLAR